MVCTLQSAALGDRRSTRYPTGARSHYHALLWGLVRGHVEPLEDCDGSVMHDSNGVDIVKEKLDSWMGQVVDTQTKGWDGPVWAWWRRWWQ